MIALWTFGRQLGSCGDGIAVKDIKERVKQPTSLDLSVLVLLC